MRTLQTNAPLVAFYGDDFTGATDALAQYHRFGMKGLLLFGIPEEENLLQLAQGTDVVGIAGISRSLPTDKIESEVKPAFESLLKLKSRVLQYKICSTFDSSPQIGSLGKVVEIARNMLGQYTVPVVPAQPDFGRYTIFGHHFARDSTEINTVYRLDRHPGISRHPSTPMNESDLVLHLCQQTNLSVRSFDLLSLAGGAESYESIWNSLVKANTGAVIFDALENQHLVRIARLIWPKSHEPTRFIMGSGGISFGLGSVMSKNGSFSRKTMKALSPVKQILVVSGSAARQTEQQIRWALYHGWHGIRLDIPRLMEENARYLHLEAVIQEVMESIVRGLNVVVYTALGPNDQSIELSINEMRNRQIERHELTILVGSFFGNIVQRVFGETDLKRVIIAGGDTSGYAVKTVDSYGLEIAGQIVQNGALCTLRSSNAKINGKEVLLKGGQVGGEDTFEVVRNGGEVLGIS